MKTWLYNLFDKESFGKVLVERGIDLNIDFANEEQVGESFDLMDKRMKLLEEGRMDIEFPEDVRGFNFLRMVASMATRGKSWYVQKEAGLFKKRLGSMENKDMIPFLNENIFGGTVIKGISKDELEHYDDRDKNGKVKVMWQYFSRIISDREVPIAEGWIYSHLDAIVVEAVRMFKRTLQSNLNETERRIKKAGLDEVFSGYSEMVDAKVESVALPEGTGMVGFIQRSPLCIRKMDASLSHGVDIGYNGYLILSFFLKTFKDRDELVNYFYERNPLNKKNHANLVDFLARRRELDYIFKQMYGETGGGVSYKSYACGKISKELLCPFHAMKSMDDKIREERITDLINSMDELEGIDDGVKRSAVNIMARVLEKGYANRACGFEFELRFETGKTVDILSGKRKDTKRKRRQIWHPVKAYIEEVLKMEKEQKNKN